jgi:hypothetical protein
MSLVKGYLPDGQGMLCKENEEVHEIRQVFFGEPFKKSDFHAVIFEFIEINVKSDRWIR